MGWPWLKCCICQTSNSGKQSVWIQASGNIMDNIPTETDLLLKSKIFFSKQKHYYIFLLDSWQFFLNRTQELHEYCFLDWLLFCVIVQYFYLCKVSSTTESHTRTQTNFVSWYTVCVQHCTDSKYFCLYKSFTPKTLENKAHIQKYQCCHLQHWHGNEHACANFDDCPG